MHHVILSRIEDREFNHVHSHHSFEFSRFLLEDCSVENIFKIIGWNTLQEELELNKRLRFESASLDKLPMKPTLEVTVPLGLNKDLFAQAVKEVSEFCNFGTG
jgi:hypothetical protein